MIINKTSLMDIAVRYLGGEDGKAKLITNDEREILLFSLYIESVARQGKMREAVDKAMANRPKVEGIR